MNEGRKVDYEGLLGVCLSGSGSSIMALAVSDFEALGRRMQSILEAKGVSSSVRVLDIDRQGGHVRPTTHENK